MTDTVIKLKVLRLLSVVSLLIVLLFGAVIPVNAADGINRQINFQGKVVNSNGTNVTDGSYSFLFCIYTTASPATPCTAGANNDAVWRESKTISVAGGIFRTSLGDTTSLPGSVNFNSDSLYLGVNFNGDGQMTPLIRFASVPYAFNAEKVNGLTVTNTSDSPFSSTTTLKIADGQSVIFNNGLTFSGTNGTTFTFPSGDGTVVTNDSNISLTNKTIGSTGLSFSGASTDVSTVSNEDFTVIPNGSGNIVLHSDFNSGVRIYDSSGSPPTAATLSVSGGIGANAAFILNQTNNADIFAASASGTTKFRIANNGDITLTGAINLGGSTGAGQCLTGGAAASWGACGGGGTNFWQLNTSTGVLAPGNLTADILFGGTATASAKFQFLNLAGGVPTFKVFDSGMTKSVSLYHDGTNGNLSVSSGVLNIGAGSGDITIAPGSNNAIINLASTGDFLIRDNGTTFATFDDTAHFGLGTTSPISMLHVTRPLTFEATGKALAVFDQIENQDILTASAAGVTRFRITNAGIASASAGFTIEGSGNIQSTNARTLTIGGGTTGNVLLAPQGSGQVQFHGFPNRIDTLGNLTLAGSVTAVSASFTNSTNQLVLSSGNTGTITLATLTSSRIYTLPNASGTVCVSGDTCASSGTVGYWNLGTLGALFAGNTTADFLIGGSSTSSAKFAVINVANSNSPIASLSATTVSGGTGAGLVFDTSTDSIQSLLKRNLTIGGSTTGNIDLTTSAFTGVRIGSSQTLNTPSVLSVSGGRGANAALIVNNTNASMDILSASSAGATRFTVKSDGNASSSAGFTIDAIGSLQSTAFKELIIGGNSTGNITIAPQNGGGIVVIGGGGNGLTFDIANGGPTYNGTARPTKTITIFPEYAGAVITASGSASFNGSLTSDASASAALNRTYYEWTSTQTSLQDYTVAVRVKLPKDFSDWVQTGNAMTIAYNTGSNVTQTNGLDVYIYNSSDDATGRPVYFSIDNVSAKTWTTINLPAARLDNNNTPDWDAADESVTIYLKMKASGTYNYTQIGDITLNYLSKF